MCDTEYNITAEAMNKKEIELKNLIKYYKENKEQIIRIKFMEVELNRLKSEIDIEYNNLVTKQRQERIQLERIKYCKENCQAAFDMLYYQNNHNQMMQIQSNRGSISIDIKVIDSLLCNGTYRLIYNFDKINSTTYNVSCIINNDKKCIINGIYTTEKGFVEN
jgi:hypothetical protein